ncbi:MAG: helix-turn-helix domain-containing protein [Deltaproteobacteria bacterium]|nr:helix-turn-helix domain-containing protein [Deltaproteobacteria bacterium]
MYTIREAAEVLQCNPESLRRLCREGKLNAEKIDAPLTNQEVWIIYQLPPPLRVGRPKKGAEQ